MTTSYLRCARLAGEQTGTVLDLRVSSVALLNPSHVYISGTAINKPGCAATAHWAFDSDTPAGRSFLAVLVAATASGQTVKIFGTGSCTLRPDMESIAQIAVVP